MNGRDPAVYSRVTWVKACICFAIYFVPAQPFTLVTWVKTFVCLTNIIYPRRSHGFHDSWVKASVHFANPIYPSKLLFLLVHVTPESVSLPDACRPPAADPEYEVAESTLLLNHVNVGVGGRSSLLSPSVRPPPPHASSKDPLYGQVRKRHDSWDLRLTTGWHGIPIPHTRTVDNENAMEYLASPPADVGFPSPHTHLDNENAMDTL